MTELDKGLRDWVESAPPVTPEEIIAVARAGANDSERAVARWTRPIFIVASALAVGIAAVASTSLRDSEPDSVLTGPSSTATPSPASAESLSAELVNADSGPLTVRIGEPMEADAAGAWMQHEITFINDGAEEVYLADTRIAEVVGDSDNPLLVGGDGCSFGVHPDEGTVVPFCNADLRGYTIAPGEAQTLLLRIWRDLPVGGPSHGKYEFTQPIVFTDDPDLFRRPPDDPALTQGFLILKYDVSAAPAG